MSTATLSIAISTSIEPEYDVAATCHDCGETYSWRGSLRDGVPRHRCAAALARRVAELEARLAALETRVNDHWSAHAAPAKGSDQ